jgi:hypothetical protein
VDASLRLTILSSGGDELARTQIGGQSADLTVVTLGCKEMKTRQGLFDESSDVLEFPECFGNNWDALSDCVPELSWLELGEVPGQAG